MSGRVTALRGWFRQQRQHHAFRIAPAHWDEPVRGQLEQLLAEAAPPERPPPRLDDKSLAEAAGQLWRAQRRLVQQGDAESRRSRQTSRYLESCREALADAGLVVQEHTGDAYHAGRALDVLVYQEEPDLTTETVMGTVRPSIYFEGRLIQEGQVIVGTPADRSHSSRVRNEHA